MRWFIGFEGGRPSAKSCAALYYALFKSRPENFLAYDATLVTSRPSNLFNFHHHGARVLPRISQWYNTGLKKYFCL